ncbi:MAG: sialidase family protein, partial [Planctomycetota bacterium]
EVSGIQHVFFNVSRDGGTIWEVPQQIDHAMTGAGARFPAMAVTPQGTIHVVWEDRRTTTKYELYRSYSDDGGLTWADDILLLTDSLDLNHQRPDFAVDSNGVIYCACQGPLGDIKVASSNDDGINWSNWVVINDIAWAAGGHPRIAIAPDDSIYVVWDYEDFTPPVISKFVFCSRSTDGGLTWPFDIVVDESTDFFVRLSRVAVDC